MNWTGYKHKTYPWVCYEQAEFLRPGKLICDKCRKNEEFILRLGANIAEEEAANKFIEAHKVCK